MTWELVATIVASLAAFVALAWIALPYVKARSSAENRIHALEAANVQIADRLARVEQEFEMRGSRPRGLPAVSR